MRDLAQKMLLSGVCPLLKARVQDFWRYGGRMAVEIGREGEEKGGGEGSAEREGAEQPGDLSRCTKCGVYGKITLDI